MLNLAVTARDAMPSGWEANSRTGNNPHELRVKPSRGRAWQYVVIAVTDTGAGMDAETHSSSVRTILPLSRG
ncbi:signal transduction histidine kinase [Nitrobacter vulgaris]|nr:signal transduction histidine kinase [Nitrobacter vulgaris]